MTDETEEYLADQAPPAGHSWGVLRKYTPAFNITRMLETLAGLETAQMYPTRIGCGFTPDVVQLKGIPVTRDTAVPEGYCFFYTDRPILLEVDI